MTTRWALPVILATVTLDAAGIGLVMPVLPDLLRGFRVGDQVAFHFGALTALFALMQLGCAPMLGAVSDRFGRRPVLVASLAGAAIDYAIVAAAPALWLLYLGRIVAGVTAATGAVAAASIADLTEPEQRARRFGQMEACMGFGFIAGPVIGGLVGTLSPRAPFVAAAVFNAATCLATWWFLPETRRGVGEPIRLARLNPLASLVWLARLPAVRALVVILAVMQLAGQLPGSLWVLYGEDRFQWTPATVGLTLAGFGAMHAAIQAFVVGPLTARIGNGRAVLLGLGADVSGFVLMAIVWRGWMVGPVMLLMVSGGIAAPALMAMLSSRVDQDAQGRLQGSLAGVAGIAAVIGPLGFTAIYAATAAAWTGWVWLIGAALFGLCLPALKSLFTDEARAPS